MHMHMHMCICMRMCMHMCIPTVWDKRTKWQYEHVVSWSVLRKVAL